MRDDGGGGASGDGDGGGGDPSVVAWEPPAQRPLAFLPRHPTRRTAAKAGAERAETMPSGG